jgi:hypothetical protein
MVCSPTGGFIGGLGGACVGIGSVPAVPLSVGALMSGVEGGVCI